MARYRIPALPLVQPRKDVSRHDFQRVPKQVPNPHFRLSVNSQGTSVGYYPDEERKPEGNSDGVRYEGGAPTR